MGENPARRGEGLAVAVSARSARLVSQQAVPLHGGMGMTAELRIGRYFKRLALCAAQFGDADAWLARLERLTHGDAATSR